MKLRTGIMGLAGTVSALLLASLSAVADPAPATIQIRPNSIFKLATFFNVGTDCASPAAPLITITVMPANGRVFLRDGVVAVAAAPDDPNSRCNGRDVAALEAWYVPNKDYSGPDNLTIEDVTFASKKSVHQYLLNVLKPQ